MANGAKPEPAAGPEDAPLGRTRTRAWDSSREKHTQDSYILYMTRLKGPERGTVHSTGYGAATGKDKKHIGLVG